MLTITPFLWFDTQAEEAMNFYASIFPDAKAIAVNRAGDRVVSVTYELQGQRFIGLNAGPDFKFNEAVSFFVACETQQEIDDLWTKLIAGGGAPSRCGWLKDKFGLSWQIIPNALGRLMGGGGDPAKAKRVMDAMFSMDKMDIARLERAYGGQ
jgi:predicted 3-demethylubiquinone-9 3-methyltransferase (glyoxalase superfamily)